MKKASSISAGKGHNICWNFRLYRSSLTADGDSKGPYFFFAGQPVHRPYYSVFYRRSQSSQSPRDFQPLIGYLDYLDVSGFRMKKLGGHLFAKSLSRVTPNEWTEDPYFLCVLLSIAQLQERLLKNSSPTSHMVCPLLVLHFSLLLV